MQSKRRLTTFSSYQGDILLDPTDLNGVVSETRIWANGTIPYTFWEADFGE